MSHSNVRVRILLSSICITASDNNDEGLSSIAIRQVRIKRGGGRGSEHPPGKSQVILVSIGNKRLDPPGKCWTPLKP